MKASSSSVGGKGKGDPIKSTISFSLFFTATLNPNSRLLSVLHHLPERGKKFRGREGREGRLQRVRTSLMRDRGRAREEAFSISRRLSKRERRGVSTEKRERERRGEGGREEGRRNAWPSLPSSSRAAKSGRNKEEAGRGEGLSRIQATGARRGERGTEARTPNPTRDQGVVCAEGGKLLRKSEAYGGRTEEPKGGTVEVKLIVPTVSPSSLYRPNASLRQPRM